MTLTKAKANDRLKNRLGTFIEIVGTVDGADYADAWVWALGMLGVTTADILDVDDADFSTLTGVKIQACLDLGELRMLETIWQNFKLVSQSMQNVSEDFGELNKQLAEMLKRKRNDVAAQYGHLLVAPLTHKDAERLFGDMERDTLPTRRVRAVSIA